MVSLASLFCFQQFLIGGIFEIELIQSWTVYAKVCVILHVKSISLKINLKQFSLRCNMHFTSFIWVYVMLIDL